MTHVVEIDTKDLTVTPLFLHVSVEDIHASERTGELVKRHIEAVQVQVAGSRLYSPTFPVDAEWKREGAKVITYAERWADQYRDWKAGEDQHAIGTPLENLKKFGISDSLLSFCRALKIYSIEALHSLEGSSARSLGMHQNALKEMAQRWMDEHDGANVSALREANAGMQAELDAMKAQMAAIMAKVQPAVDPAEIAEAEAKADAEADGLELARAEYERIHGKRPHHNMKLETILQMNAEAS